MPPKEHRSQTNISLGSDGRFRLANGMAEFGNGTMNTLHQIASHILGCRAADVEMVIGDTDKTPYDGGMFASAGSSVCAKSVELAANGLKERLLSAAARLLDRPAADGRLIGGRADFEDLSISLSDLYQRTPQANLRFNVKRRAYCTPTTLGFLVHGFRVAVNKETCEIRILQSVHAADAGVVLNPMQLTGQIEGGIAQGIGSTLFERVVTDENGNVRNSTLRDYRIPTLADIPRTEIFYADTVDRVGALGTKPMVESSIVPVSAALGNAVKDAIGVRLASLPFSADRVYEALYGGE